MQSMAVLFKMISHIVALFDFVLLKQKKEEGQGLKLWQRKNFPFNVDVTNGVFFFSYIFNNTKILIVRNYKINLFRMWMK